MTDDAEAFDSQHRIFAGKFRRYHGESWLTRITEIRTNLLNIRDAFYAVIGIVQSYFLLRRLRPDVILLKGGFVGVPVGLAAAALNIPFITHDSDAIPGLANRLVSKWASLHAVAMAPENYKYPKQHTIQVGVLVGEAYKPVTAALRKEYLKELDMPDDAEVLFVTGGSGGAVVINTAIRELVPELLTARPKLQIVHQVGPGRDDFYGDYADKRLFVRPLLEKMYRYSGAADVIVSRAGANTLAEFGVQGKACIIIPNPLLTGGHQLKNAELLEKAGAVAVVTEDSIAEGKGSLGQAITDLLENSKQRHELGHKLQEITIPDAAEKLAELIFEVGEGE